MGGIRNVYRISDGKYEGKRPLRRPRCSREDNIKMNLKYIRCGLHSYGSGLGPTAGSCEQSDEPSGSIKGGKFLD
jgi:hypothetical protein